MNRNLKLVALCLALAALLAACGGTNRQEAPSLSIDAAALGAEPTFIDHTQDGVAMQLIAIKDADNTVRLRSTPASPAAARPMRGSSTSETTPCNARTAA